MEREGKKAYPASLKSQYSGFSLLGLSVRRTGYGEEVAYLIFHFPHIFLPSIPQSKMVRPNASPRTWLSFPDMLEATGKERRRRHRVNNFHQITSLDFELLISYNLHDLGSVA